MTAKVTFDSDRCKGCELVCQRLPQAYRGHQHQRHQPQGLPSGRCHRHYPVYRLRQLRQDLPGFHHHRGKILKKEVINRGKGTLER